MFSTSDDVIPFDEVSLNVEGRARTISVADFFSLPISERVRHVIERTVTFRSRGRVVEQRAALAALRRYRAASGGA